MPQRQVHRGRHPQDAAFFAPKCVPVLRNAVADLSYLLSRGYSDSAAARIVGDHYQLASRQRNAVSRGACASQSAAYRRSHEIKPERLCGRRIAIDAYNVIISAETALSNGIMFLCRDGCIRDIAGIHGSYRSVAETVPALTLLGEVLEECGVDCAEWYLDAPVSNSGRLRALMLATAEAHKWRWRVELAQNPDRQLVKTGLPVVTTDGAVLDRAPAWVNLAPLVLRRIQPAPLIIDLSPMPVSGTLRNHER